MIIRNIKHRGLKRFVETDDPRELNVELVSRIRNVIAALVLADTMSDLSGPPGWRIHMLKGNLAGIWSISVSGNWRITFSVVTDEVIDLNLEDYH
jgi:toxin HigB-1